MLADMQLVTFWETCQCSQSKQNWIGTATLDCHNSAIGTGVVVTVVLSVVDIYFYLFIYLYQTAEVHNSENKQTEQTEVTKPSSH